MFLVLTYPKAESEEVIYGTISGDPEWPIWEISLCPKCGRHRHLKQIRNLRIEIHGSLLKDFVWLDSPEIVVNSSLMHFLRDSDLKGFSFTGVDVAAWWRTDPETGEIVNWLKRETAPHLFQMVVLGKGGSAMPKNKIRIQSVCDVCGVTVYEPLKGGLLVDEKQWDGSDVFVLSEFPGYVFITDRFLIYLKEKHVQGYTAIPAIEFSM